MLCRAKIFKVQKSVYKFAFCIIILCVIIRPAAASGGVIGAVMSLICQQCKKRPATVNFIDTVGGEKVALHLCEQCYKYKYGEFESVMSDAILSGLLGEAAPAKNKVCRVCGMRFEEYERTGLLGCSSCYDVFKDELMPSIERIQGKTRHVGKEGGDHSAEHDLRLRLKALQEQLEAALTRGDYPSASRLNRQMTAIKNAMNGGANG